MAFTGAPRASTTRQQPPRAARLQPQPQHGEWLETHEAILPPPVQPQSELAGAGASQVWAQAVAGGGARGGGARAGGGSNLAHKYRGVCKHSSGRFQANLRVKGKLLHLGRHVTPEAAARAFDRASLFVRGEDAAKTNFPAADYNAWLTATKTSGATLTQVATQLRQEPSPARKLSGRAATSKYKGVWAHANGRWQSNIRVKGKLVRLGTHRLEVAAARAFDLASIKQDAEAAKKPGALNFPIDEYGSTGQLANILSMAFDELVKVLREQGRLSTKELAPEAGGAGPLPGGAGAPQDGAGPPLPLPPTPAPRAAPAVPIRVDVYPLQRGVSAPEGGGTGAPVALAAAAADMLASDTAVASEQLGPPMPPVPAADRVLGGYAYQYMQPVAAPGQSPAVAWANPPAVPLATGGGRGSPLAHWSGTPPSPPAQPSLAFPQPQLQPSILLEGAPTQQLAGTGGRTLRTPAFELTAKAYSSPPVP